MTAAELDLDAIEARADDATEGPWQAVNDPSDDGGYPECSFGVATGDETCIFEDIDTLRADAEFIAAARTDVPALVAEVRRLRAYAETTRYHQQQHAEAVREVERLRAALGEAGQACECGDKWCPAAIARRALASKPGVA